MKRSPFQFIIFLLLAVGFIGGISWFIIYVLSYFFAPSHTILVWMYIKSTSVPLILIITMIIGNSKYSKINSLLYTVFVFWIPLLLDFFIGLAIISILNIFIPTSAALACIYILTALIGISFIVGIYNACNPRIVSHAIRAPKLKEKWGDKNLVLFSDAHLGMVRNKKFMRTIVDMVNSLHPDIVFIAGDLIDGPVFPYEESLAPLADIKSTYGTFYTAGNHDEYNPEQEKYYSALQKYVTVLNDKKVIVNDTQITGIIYAQESVEETAKRLRSVEHDARMPSIVMLHDPKNIQALADQQVTLGLSGHTHAGQFFPFTLIVKSVYGSLTKGVHYLKEMAHITSVGVGTAGPLLRLGTVPEIIHIRIE